MSDIQVITLRPSIYHETFSSIDICSELQSSLVDGKLCKLELQSNELWFSKLPLTLHELTSQASSCKVFALLTIAGQSLTLRGVAQILSELLPEESTLYMQTNPFGQIFATQAVDIYCEHDVVLDKTRLTEASIRYHVDIIQKSKASFAQPGLLVMDMDSTIIAMECIDEIADLAGVKDKVSAVTERAMEGEIPFTQSLHDRVACLEGLAVQDLLSIRQRLPFMPNFMHTMKILKAANWKLAIASGGFTFFADYVKQLAQLDAAYSNLLDVQDGRLTGRLIGKVVDANEKARVLLLLAETFAIPKAQTLAMGDGANDVNMMEQAGTSVAYHAKPVISSNADVVIRYGGFESLLFSLR